MNIFKEQESQWLKQFLYSSHIAVLVVNYDGKSLFVNEYFCKLFGYSKNELLQQSTEIFHTSYESFLEFSDIAFKSLLEGKSVNIDYQVKHKDGTKFWVNISGDLIENKNEILWIIIDITKRVETKEELLYLKERMELAIDANRDVVWDWNLITNKLFVSSEWKDVIGHDSKKTPYEIKIWRKHLHKEDRKKVFQDIDNAINKKTKYLDNIHRIQHSDGHWLWIHIRAKVLFDKYNKAIRMIGTHRNITKTKELQLKNAQQAQIIKQIHESVISTDLNGNICTWNRGSEVLLGYKADEVIGQHIKMIFYKKYHEKVYKNINTLLDKGEYHAEVRLVKKSNDIIIADLSASLMKDEKDNPIGMIGYIQDITERKKAQEELLNQKEILHYQANHDSLTLLPNRLLFHNKLKESIWRAKRNQKKLALLFIDLDHFKEINDSLGHGVGDKVLKEVSKRLKQIIRKSDTLARLGGDEFTIIIEDLEQGSYASIFAKKIIDMLTSAMIIEEHKLYVSSSIGISIYPDDGTSTQNLLKYADVAMYKAKEEDRNNFQFYSSEMTKLAYQKVKIDTDLRDALKNENFIVYYQPEIDAKTDTVIGVEALSRWEHLEKGLLLPQQFMHLANSTGLIIELDKYIMKKAMIQIVKWHNQKLNPGILALNLSIKYIYEKDFLFQLKQMLEDTGCKAKWIELEITENQMMKNPQKTMEVLHQINNLGIKLTIDDFGIGYSSLAYLNKLPISKLKIDRSFIKNIPNDSSNVSIVKSIIALATNLNIEVIVKGISTKKERDLIMKNGCNNMQGYYYSKPLSNEDMDKFLKN